MKSPFFDPNRYDLTPTPRSALFRRALQDGQFGKNAPNKAIDVRKRPRQDPNTLTQKTIPFHFPENKKTQNLPVVVRRKSPSQPPLKRNRTTRERDLTRVCLWGGYIGEHKKEAICPLCVMNAIRRDDNAAWDGTHFAPQHKDQRNNQSEGLSRIIVQIPACRSCNNRMGERNLFDYLYEAGKIKRMCKVAWLWWTIYPNPEAKKNCQNVLWRLVKRHFGREHFPNGGGIENDQVYHVLARYQQKKLSKEIDQLNAKLQKRIALSSLIGKSINT